MGGWGTAVAALPGGAGARSGAARLHGVMHGESDVNHAAATLQAPSGRRWMEGAHVQLAGLELMSAPSADAAVMRTADDAAHAKASVIIRTRN